MSILHNTTKNDTLSKRLWMSFAILFVFGLFTTFPMALSLYAFEKEVWLLQGMNIEPNIVTNSVVGICLIAIAIAGFIGTCLGLFMIGDVLRNGFAHTFHVFEDLDDKAHSH